MIKELAKENVFIINEKQLNVSQKEFVKNYFNTDIVSNLFPIMIDENKSFPYMKDKASYLYLKLGSIIPNQKINTHL